MSLSLAAPPAYARVDFDAIARVQGVDFSLARAALLACYDEIDAHHQRNTQGLALPCQRGCDACCHESVFLTPLEFMVVWEWFTEHASDQDYQQTTRAWLGLYDQNQTLITKLEGTLDADERFATAKAIRFRCPFLDAEGGCRVYPVRELCARLFGASFNDEGGVYGCDLVGKYLGSRTVTLVGASRAVERLRNLPFTSKRQVYPYYVHLLLS